MRSPLPVLIAVGLLLSACVDRPPDFSNLMKDDPVAKRQSSISPPPTTNDLVVYLDTSRSMAGYLIQDKHKPSVFSRTLQEIRNVSTMLNPPLNVRVKRVSADVSGSLNDTFLSEAAITQSIFSGTETNLSAAIDTFSVPISVQTPAPQITKKVADQDANQEAQAPARFHILVTDGVQSTRQSRDTACTAGSDQICVRKKILALLKDGWSAYVIGLRSEFKGKLYSEINGSVIPYVTTDTESHRPFYLYLFSPDHAGLDGLVNVLKRRLQPLLQSEDSLRVVALAARYSDGFGDAELLIEKDPSNSITSQPPNEANPFRTTIKVSLDTEKGTPKQFSIRTRINWAESVRLSGTPQELASIVNWELVSVFPSNPDVKGVRLPLLKIIAVEPQLNGDVKLRLTASWPRANGDPSWRGYRLEGRLKLDQQTPDWVKQWSTDTDTSFDTGNRTLFLESALLGLWQNEELQNQIVSEIYIRVGSK